MDSLQLNDEESSGEFKKTDAILRFYYKIDPDQLGDQEYIKLLTEYAYVRKEERNFYIGILRQVVSEAFGKG